MKNKTLAMVEIVVVLCSVFLVALPAIAAEPTAQEEVSTAEVTTAASEDDFVLGIYGNANEDDTIDMRDVTYTKLVIFGKKPETELADAYYDGEVDVLDVVQVKLIILGRESELTVIDSCENIVTFKLPIERVAVFHLPEFMVALGAFDRVVGVTSYMHTSDILTTVYPDITEIPAFGSSSSPDYEALLAMEPDVVIIWDYYPEVVEEIKSLGIPIFEINTVKAKDIYTLQKEVLKIGYLLNEEERAREVISYMDEIESLVKDRVTTIPEDERRKGIFLYSVDPPKVTTAGQKWEIAGIIDVAEEMFPEGGSGEVDIETIMDWDPDIIYIWHWSGSPEEIYGSEQWQGVRAVIDEKVFKDYYISTWAPEVITLVLDHAMKAYPELFEGIDFEETYEEFTENVYWVKVAPMPGKT